MRPNKSRERTTEFPYYVIQYWDEFSICWVSFHKKFPDPVKAENFALTLGKRYRTGNKYRIMEVTQNDRKIFKTSE
ncbi:MAG: hypothetical protein PHO26_07375 [Dehalococcoidia bacterium]|nr:hypothetical protein [Dehalococcoidia bacterium]MDD5494950.1 hypothetical protein [Dehalococcoidia bacterium]